MDLPIISGCFSCMLLSCTIFVTVGLGKPLQDVANGIGVYKDQPNTVNEPLWDQSNISLERHKRSSTVGLVDIARFIDTSGPGKIHIVYVDDTMTRLVFQVAVERSKPVLMVNNPVGPYLGHPSLNGSAGSGTVIGTMDIPISTGDYGFWKFSKLDGSTWDVTIKGESPVYIKQQLFESGTNTTITDAPVVGNKYKVEVEVIGFSNVNSVDTGMLFTKSKLSPAAYIMLVPKGGGKFEADTVTMPDEVFMVGIQGKDKSGHLYKRIDPTEITPVTVSLYVPSYIGATVFEYSSFNITFTVTNLLSTTQDVDIRVSDSRGYAQAPATISTTLKVGENYTGTFVIKSEFAGLTTLAKITARQYLGSGKFTSGPEEIRNVTVITNQTTTTPISTSSSPTTTSNISVTTSNLKQAASTVVLSNSSTLTGTVSQATTGYTSNKSANGHANTFLSTATSLAVNPSNTGTKSSMITMSSLTAKHGVTTSPLLAPRQTSITPSGRNNNMSGHSPVLAGLSRVVTAVATPRSTDVPATGGGRSGSRPGSSGSHSESNKDSTNVEISAGVIVASMVTGTIVGVAAIATMAVVFKKAMTKMHKRVAPVDRGNEASMPVS